MLNKIADPIRKVTIITWPVSDGGVTFYLACVSGAVCRPDKRSASGKTQTCGRFESSISQIAKKRL